MKRGWKTWQFWVVLLGNLVSLASAAKGIMPPQAALILNTALATLYNIIRGMAKSDEEGVREWWKASETWVAAATQLNNGIVMAQQGGVNAEWMATTSTVIAAAIALARDLSHKQPETAK